MKYSFPSAGRDRMIEVTQQGSTIHVWLDGHPRQIGSEPRDGGVLLLHIDGQPVTAITAAVGTSRHVSVNGQTFVLQRDEQRRRRSPAAAAGELTATMPGQIIAVSARAGERVERGQTLVILEAMKMELRVTAPAAGEIAAVRCAVGDVVERGQVLVEME